MIDKNRIEEAALIMVEEKGYKTVRMEDLAAYLGISKKTLYNHFSSKEVLIKEALGRKVEESLTLLETISDDRTIDFIPRLIKVLQTAGRALILKEGYTGDLSLPRDIIESIFPKLQDHILQMVSHLVDEGLRDGYVRLDIPSEVLPYIHLGIIESFLTMESRFGVKATLRDMLKFIETIVFSGLLTEKGKEALNKGGGIEN